MFTNIRLQNFRSYKNVAFEFGDGVNIIVGPNAKGKTNLLEAILVLAAGQPYRGKDLELIRNNEVWARLDAQTGNETRTNKYETNETGQLRKTFLVNDKSSKKLNFEQRLPVVLFEPSHLNLFNSEPANRREFLDQLLEQLEPGFDEMLARYQKTLRQRNALLKRNPPNLNDQIFAWNVRLSEQGGQIAAARQKLTEQINSTLSSVYSKLASQKTKLNISYETKLNIQNYTNSLMKKLEKELELDRLRGYTGNGPHRDDFAITLNGNNVQTHASRGEARTLLLSLKAIELDLLEKKRRQSPILLLDDVFSELDGKRRKALTSFLKGHQAFITTTDADLVGKNFTQKCTVIAIN